MKHPISLSRRIRYLAEYSAAYSGHKILTRIPKEKGVWIADKVAGPILYFSLRKYRKRTLSNLSHLFPDSQISERKSVALRVFSHLALVAAEYSYYPATQDKIELEIDTQSRRNLETVEKQLNPVIFVSPHLGNWEILLASNGGLRLDIQTITRPLDNPWLDKWLKSIRQENGAVTISPLGSFKSATNALRNGKSFAYMADQNRRKHIVKTEFFGQPAPTGIGPALLSIRSNRPIVPISLVREGKPFRFRLLASDPISGDPGIPLRDSLIQITQDYTSVFEEWIRTFPDQWLWAHRRWKIKSRNEGSFPN